MEFIEEYHDFSEAICIPIFNTFLITSNISTSYNEARRPKVLFSCMENCENQLKIFQFDQHGFLDERCKVPLPEYGVLTMWRPDMDPTQTEIIATANSSLQLFTYDERGLNNLVELMESNYYYRIKSLDWNRYQLEQIATLRKNGRCQVLNYSIATPRRQVINTFRFDKGCVLRYGGGCMKNGLLCLETDGNVNFVDLRTNWKQRLHRFDHDRMTHMEYCTNDEYAVAFSSRRKVKLFDSRFMKRDCFQYENELDEINCLCWSRNTYDLFLGTSTGRIIKGPFTSFPEACDPVGFCVSHLHAPPLMSNAILFTCDVESNSSVFIVQS